MEGIRKEDVVLVFLDENDLEKAVYCLELIINDFWVSYKTKDNWISIPTSRVIKIKEGVEKYDK